MYSFPIEHPYTIHALHGFLGSNEDWFSLGFSGKNNFYTYNLFKDIPILPFDNWVEIFNRQLKGYSKESQNILMGYSLGGRLGLHAVIQNPENWKAAIFVSTHPGLKSLEEQKSRIVSDEKWAERFEKESWDFLMKEWNAQGVFRQDAFSFKREELNYSRHSLSKALKIWSLGIQNDLTKELGSLALPILWMIGSEDIKFLKKAQELKFKHPLSQLCVISEAGHRVPWQQPEKYLLTVTKFIQNLEKAR